MKQSCRFNKGFIGTNGLALTFTRNDQCYNPGEETLYAANTPRYSAEQLTVCSHPVVTTVDNRAGNPTFALMGGGRWLDNETNVVMARVVDGNTAEFAIHLNGYNVANATAAGRLKDIGGTGTKLGKQDLLKGSPDEDARWFYRPVSATCCRGCIVVTCEAWYDTTGGGVWSSRKTTACYWDETNKQWRKLCNGDPAVTTAEGNTNQRGEVWAQQNYWNISGNNPPTQVYFSWVDYVFNSGAVGGRVWLVRANYSNSAWTFEQPILLDVQNAATSGTHYHCVAVRAWGASGIQVIVGNGDGKEIATTRSIYRADSNYTQGFSDIYTATSTGGTNGWTIETLHGVLRASNQSDGTYQFLGIAPYRGSTDILVGADEYHGSILKVSQVSAGNKINFTGIHTIMHSLDQASIAFQIYAKQDQPGFGPYLFKECPSSITTAESGSNSWSQDDSVARLIYSPDGIQFARVWSPFTYAADSSVIDINKLLTSNKNKTAIKLRGVTIPVLASGFPLLIGNGGTSIMEMPFTTTPSAPGTSSTVDKKSSAQLTALGIPLPPCDRNNMYLCEQFYNDANGYYAGKFKLKPNAVKASNLYVRTALWCYILPAATGKATRMAPQIKMGAKPPDTGNAIDRSYQGMAVSGQWFKIIAEADLTGLGGLSDPYDLGIWFKTSSNGAASNNKFVLAFEWATGAAASFGDHIGRPAIGATNLDEYARITGFAPGNASWSMFVIGQMDPNGPDSRVLGSSGNQRVISLWQDDTHYAQIKIVNNRTPANCKLQLILKYGGGAATTTDFTVPSNHSQSFLRRDNLLFAFNYTTASGDLVCVASCGGVPVATVTINAGAGNTFLPTELRTGDYNGANPQPIALHGATMYTDRYMSPTELADTLFNVKEILNVQPSNAYNRHVLSGGL